MADSEWSFGGIEMETKDNQRAGLSFRHCSFWILGQGNKKKINKLLAVVLAAILTMSLAACSSETPDESGANAESSQSSMAGSVQTDEPSSEESSASSASDGGQNILIAYFSLPLNDGVDTVTRASRKKSDDGTLGNVRFMANVIQENVGGHLFSIETVQEYPMDSMDDLLEFAYEEKAENARPELSTHIDDLDDYDVVFIGYPIWNADLPMPMYTFFEEYDFSGKTIISFVAHGGSRTSRTVDTIAELEPDATVIDDPVTVFWNELDDAENIVTEWVQNLEF